MSIFGEIIPRIYIISLFSFVKLSKNSGWTSANKLTNRKTIGQGSYGKVYKVEHEDWGPLAYKQLSSGQYIEEQSV